MSEGVIYYNKGVKCQIRLLVSLFSLRRVSKLPVCIIHEGEPDPQFVKHADMLGASVVRIPAADEVDYPLCQKPRLHRWSPFDVTLYIDADTIVMQDPAPLLPLIAEHGFAVTRFCDWTTDGRIVSGRINAFRHLAGDKYTDGALKFGPAVNTGVYGFTKGHPILEPWAELTRRAFVDSGPMGRTLDEIACQILAPLVRHTLLDAKWNSSIKFGSKDPKEIGILHMHGGKHLLDSNPLCDHWRQAYWEWRHRHGHNEWSGDAHSDRNLTKELPRVVRDDLMICLASDAVYLPKLIEGFKQWMRTPGLREQRFMLFCIGPDIEGFKFFADYKNVQVIGCMPPGDTPRERAFNAFVYEPAKYVTTPFWMKLDGDARMTGPAFKWPDYSKHTITADGWHYTKIKKEPNAEGKPHWLNRLDSWWAEKNPGAQPIFPIIEGRRHKHRRLRGYCWIERTEFTKRCAAMYGDRLILPSHDTCQWYVATRLNEPMQEYQFRGFINA